MSGKTLLKTIDQARTKLRELEECCSEAAGSLPAELRRLLDTLRAEESNHRRFQELFELAPNGYLTTDPEGTIVDVNRAAENLFGRPKDELTGTPLVRFLAPQERRAYRARIRTLLMGRVERIQDWHLVLLPDSGEPVDVEVTVERASEATGLFWLVREVTERRRAEERLRDSEKRLRDMVENLPAGAVYVEGETLFFNKATEEIIGYSRSEITTVDDWFNRLYGRRGEALRIFYERDRESGFPVPRTAALKRKDGETRYVEFVAYRYEPGEVWLLHDVTERRHAEQALRRELDFTDSLVETAPAIVLVLDTEGRIVRFNRYMEEIAGYALEEMRGKAWFESFLPERDRARIRELFERSLSAEPTRGTVNPIVTRGGEEREIEWYNTLITDTEGRVTAVLSIGQDITERRHLEAQFLQAQKMEAIGRLAGGVAHDFNTLLGAILGYSELLLEGLRPRDPLRRAAEQIQRGAERGAGLTRQLLAFSRRQVLQPRAVDLRAVLDDMDDMLRRLIGADVELARSGDPDLAWVRVDAGQMEQVILNLVVNACDAMPRGGQLAIETKNVDLERPTHVAGHTLEPGRWVMLAVIDTGCGMDEETRSRLFEPFFTTKDPGKGTGLGLSTVYGIVRQSGGGILVDSAPESGATFRIFLPPVAAAPKAEVAPVAEAAPAVGAETVLLVEDDDMFRELLAEVLASNGYTVLPAADPAAAIATYEEHDGEVDLVVSDMVMPGMTGLELAQDLARRRDGLKVLLMSGYTDADLAERGLSEGDAPFIQKPFSTKELLREVRRVLGA